MSQESLLKEILDALENLDEVQLFATANGLVGDVEVENRLRKLQQEKQLQWENHIDNLRQDVLPDIFETESPIKKIRCSVDGDQPSTSGQSGVGKVLILRTRMKNLIIIERESKDAGGQLTSNTVNRYSQMLGIGKNIQSIFNEQVVFKPYHT